VESKREREHRITYVHALRQVVKQGRALAAAGVTLEQLLDAQELAAENMSEVPS
jgi:hypothetical protein